MEKPGIPVIPWFDDTVTVFIKPLKKVLYGIYVLQDLFYVSSY